MEDRALVISRVLALVTYVERHPGIHVSDLAAHFGRTEKQITRDIDLLDHAGYGEFYPDQTFEIDYDLYTEQKRLIIVRNLEVASTPKLTSSEMVALITGIDLIAAKIGGEDAALGPRLVAKLLALGDARKVENRAVVNHLDSQSDLHTEILQAVRNRCQARIRYQSATRESSRVIEPGTLMQLDDGWLLGAWCHQAAAPRSFRLDRITEWETLDIEATMPRAKPQIAGEECCVYLRPEALWRVSDWSRAKQLPDGRIEARYTVAQPDWMIARLIQMGSDVESTEPARWLQQAREVAHDASAVWRSWEPLQLD